MSLHLFSDLEKHSILKVQIVQGVLFFFFFYGIDVWYDNLLWVFWNFLSVTVMPDVCAQTKTCGKISFW